MTVRAFPGLYFLPLSSAAQLRQMAIHVERHTACFLVFGRERKKTKRTSQPQETNRSNTSMSYRNLRGEGVKLRDVRQQCDWRLRDSVRGSASL
jgi:hypothetical protein